MRQWLTQRTPEQVKAQHDRISAWRRKKKAADPEYARRVRELTHKGRTPEAHRAHEAVRRAVKSGRLVRPDLCERCGEAGLIEAAHHDYSQRLDVTWLCRPCHRRYDTTPKGGYIRVADRGCY